MLVYRLCWGENLRVGFYRPGNDDSVSGDKHHQRRELTDKFQYGALHPGPYSDPNLSFCFDHTKHYFGFSTPESLKRWFYKCHKTMTRLGCKVAVMKVERHFVLIGSKQCVFESNKYSTVKYFDITDPAWETYEGVTE